jgi:hypothetical protein
MLNDKNSVRSAFAPVTNVLTRMQKMFRIAWAAIQTHAPRQMQNKAW